MHNEYTNESINSLKLATTSQKFKQYIK